jgi:hypothetical protein
VPTDRAPTLSGSGENDEDTFNEGDSAAVEVVVVEEVRRTGDGGCVVLAEEAAPDDE